MNPFELKIRRIKHGLRQYQVAAAVGIAPCRLSEIETGRRDPSPELLRKIEKVIVTIVPGKASECRQRLLRLLWLRLLSNAQFHAGDKEGKGGKG